MGWDQNGSSPESHTADNIVSPFSIISYFPYKKTVIGVSCVTYLNNKGV